jgi:hypothetical protein
VPVSPGIASHAKRLRAKNCEDGRFKFKNSNCLLSVLVSEQYVQRVVYESLWVTQEALPRQNGNGGTLIGQPEGGERVFSRLANEHENWPRLDS